MTPIEHTAKVLKIAVPILFAVGATAWWFPATFERMFGFNALVAAQFVGLPAMWLIAAAANILIMAAIIGLLFCLGLALKRLSGTK